MSEFFFLGLQALLVKWELLFNALLGALHVHHGVLSAHLLVAEACAAFEFFLVEGIVETAHFSAQTGGFLGERGEFVLVALVLNLELGLLEMPFRVAVGDAALADGVAALVDELDLAGREDVGVEAHFVHDLLDLLGGGFIREGRRHRSFLNSNRVVGDLNSKRFIL